MIQWFFISGYVLQNMLHVGFRKTFQNLSYFDQSVAYVDMYLDYRVPVISILVVMNVMKLAPYPRSFSNSNPADFFTGTD
jgi:hypothetical protein